MMNINSNNIFSQCDEIIDDYCIEHDIQRKELAKGMGISYKQLMNVLAGDVDSSFDIVATVFIGFLEEPKFNYIYTKLFALLCQDESYITAKNLFTMYELATITENKDEFVVTYLGKLKNKAKLPKTTKQAVQIILKIESTFTNDTPLDLNIQLMSINARYLSVFEPITESKPIPEWEFTTFLEYCINMRRNERIAVYYYEQGNYVQAAEIYQYLYELPVGGYHKRYLGYKLLQTHSQIRIYEPLVAKIEDVFSFSDQRFRLFLKMYIEKEYFKVPHFPLFLKYWFTKDKESLIREFEYTDRDDELYTMKLLLSDLTESCSYIL